MSIGEQHRQNTNPYNSGGGGFDVEDRYSAWCMACWLAGVRPPGCVVSSTYALIGLAMQVPKEIWLFDDLILTFEGNGARKQIGVSVKSGDYLKDGLPPKELIEDSWRQVLGKGVRGLADVDELVIAAPPIAPEHAKDWRELGDWARMQEDDTFEANVAKRNVGNAFKRSLVEAFKCPEDIAEGCAPDQLRVGRVLRRLRLVEHDYRSPSDSRLVEEGIKRCSEALLDGCRKNAEGLWNHLLRVAEAMRPNAGELTFEKLLGFIRTDHQLAAHPDDAADWSVIDGEIARRLARIPDSIGGLKLAREPVVARLRSAIGDGPLVALLADSGEGKSVCAKRLADALRAEKHRVIWLETDQICSPDGPGRRLGLNRPLEALLSRVVESGACLFVDQVDQYDDQGLSNLFHLLRSISAWNVVLIATPEGWRRIERRVTQVAEERGPLQIIHLPQLTSDEIKSVGERHPNLGRILMDQRLRRIVSRPRILDLIAQESVTHAVAAQWVSEADIIDWFFDSVVERKKGDGRRSTVVRLAARLADDFAASLPEDMIDPAEADRVAALHVDRILRVQDGRIAFDHPLLADWSKRQYLVGRQNQIADEVKSQTRRDSPEWHRALTLYSLRLVEQRKDLNSFVSLLRTLEPDGEATSTGDGLLRMVVTATDPWAVLDLLWPALSFDDELIQRLLRVNHLAGTIPDSQIKDEWFRQPISFHYPLLVAWLNAKQVELIRLAPAEAAAIAETWLRFASQLPEMPARKEAADLAFAITTAVRVDSRGDDRIPSDAKPPAFRALLAAVPVNPERAIDLLRKLAERVEDDPSARALRASRSFANSHRNNPPLSPDAPLRMVDREFCKVCREWMALEPLMSHSPECATEIILATLLRSSDSSRYGGFGRDRLDDAAASGYDWSPAMWWRGPFARLLRINESAGINLILRLVNYITEVWQHDAEHSEYRDKGPIPFMEIEVDGIFRRWPGGGLKADNVFSWHSVGHRCPTSVQCALMALEHYLYEADSEGRNVDAAIEQILRGSKSAAFAGLLAAVANHNRSLLQGSLQPLMTCAEAVWHDHLRSRSRDDKTCAGIGLQLKSAYVREQVRGWYCMSHRDISLLSQLMFFVAQETFSNLLERVRNRLDLRIADGEAEDINCPLKLFAAWYDPGNWRIESVTQGLRIEFIRPAHLQAGDEETGQLKRDQDVLLLPMHARKLLGNRLSPTDAAMENLWARFDEFAALWKDEEDQRVANSVAGIAAAAIILRSDWLKQVDGRFDAAVELIDAIAASPPPPLEFDSPNQLYDVGWDAFHADVAGALYAREPGSRDCRERVIRAAMGFHYFVVGHLLQGFACARPPDNGPTLGLLINLVTQYAALREACFLDADIRDRAAEDLNAVADDFLNGRIDVHVQPWHTAGDRWRGAICEPMMTQIIESAPRPATTDLFFVQREWPVVVEYGIDWLLRCATIAANSPSDDDRDYEVGSGHRVGRKLEVAIVQLAAEAVVHAPSEIWASNIVRKCLALPGKRHGARESFATWFASYAMGGPDDELPVNAVVRWVSFAQTVLDLDPTDSEVDELPQAALGLSSLSQYAWPEQATLAARGLAPHFERWIKSPLRDVRDASTFAYFLTRPAAKPLQLSGIEWLVSNPRFVEPLQWRHDHDRRPLLSLLESVSQAVPLGQRSAQVRDAIMQLLSALAAVGDSRASDLLRSLGAST